MNKLGIVLGLALALAALADDASHSQPFSLGPGQTAFGLEFPQFNVSGATLNQVTVTLEATFAGGMTFFSASAVDATASGGLSSAQVLVTPLVTGLIAPAAVTLPLDGTTLVPAGQIASISPDTTDTAEVSTTAAATLALYTGNGNVGYDVDFTALYPQRVAVTAPSPKPTCIVCNDWVDGQLTVNYNYDPPNPTAVVLESFSASWIELGQALVVWRTAVESNLLGFQLERQQDASPWVRVNQALIPALGGGRPNDYRFEEANLPAATVSKYRLVGVNLKGQEAVLSEVTVQVGITAEVRAIESGILLEVRGTAGSRLAIEATSAVATGPWERIGTVQLNSSGVGAAILPWETDTPLLFYRLREEGAN